MTRTLRPISALAALAAASIATAAGPELVLVAGAQSPLAQMTVADARKAFLGIPVTVNGRAIRPVRNLSDALVTELFMQRVMFMSAEDYEHQIQTRVSRTGGGRPASHGQLSGLKVALEQDPLAVSYMARSQAGSSVKIVGEP